MFFITNHIPILEVFQILFQQLHWFLQLQRCFIKWYEKEWSMKLCIHNGSWHEILNLIFYVTRFCFKQNLLFKSPIRSRPIFKHKQQTLSLSDFNTNTVALSRHYQVFTDSLELKDSGEVSVVPLHVSWLDLLFSCQLSQPLGKGLQKRISSLRKAGLFQHLLVWLAVLRW